MGNINLIGFIIAIIIALNLFLSLFNLHFFSLLDFTEEGRTLFGYLRTFALSLLFLYVANKCYDDYEKKKKKSKKK